MTSEALVMGIVAIFINIGFFTESSEKKNCGISFGSMMTYSIRIQTTCYEQINTVLLN